MYTKPPMTGLDNPINGIIIMMLIFIGFATILNKCCDEEIKSMHCVYDGEKKQFSPKELMRYKYKCKDGVQWLAEPPQKVERLNKERDSK